jgi:hypothetical protein
MANAPTAMRAAIDQLLLPITVLLAVHGAGR